MSRPCFALSVMLCCLVGPLLIIGQARARDTVVSPSHDPGECIVCPLAHSPQEPCGGYSDYDFNSYWFEDHSPSATESESTPSAGSTALEVAQPQTDGAMEHAWESDYDDYYADYVYGDDTTGTHAEDLSVQETPAPVTLTDSASAGATTPEVSQFEENVEVHDEYGWYTDAVEPGDYFGASGEPQETNAETDEAYEALSESASRVYTAETIEETAQGGEPTKQLETGYDGAYDAAMATDWEAAEPAADSLPANPATESTETSDYESFYDAYDDLYNFESVPVESLEAAELKAPEAGEATVETVVEEQSGPAVGAESAWLAGLVNRMLAPIRTAAGGVASGASILDRDSRTALYVDECANGWDCTVDNWAQPQAEQASLVLTTADTLDGIAAALQGAAEFLRGVASGHLGETAQTPNSWSPR